MQWNCPHCGTNLKSNPEQITNEWTFIRCHHCVKFALVKKSGVNIIKVDQTPPIGSYASSQVIEPAINMNASEKISVTPPPFQQPKEESNLRRNLISIGVSTAAIFLIGGGIYLQRSGNDILATPIESTTGFSVEAKTKTSVIKDELITQAMAPTRPQAEEPRKPLYVTVEGKNIILRNGPGQNFTMLTLAEAGMQYKVVDWKNQWFKVEFNSESELQTAWVRNDLVTLISPKDRKTKE